MPASVVVWVVLGCNCRPLVGVVLGCQPCCQPVSSPWLSAMEVVLGCQPCCPPGRWVVSHFDACIFVQTEHATQNATNAKTCLFLFDRCLCIRCIFSCLLCLCQYTCLVKGEPFKLQHNAQYTCLVKGEPFKLQHDAERARVVPRNMFGRIWMSGCGIAL